MPMSLVAMSLVRMSFDGAITSDGSPRSPAAEWILGLAMVASSNVKACLSAGLSAESDADIVTDPGRPEETGARTVDGGAADSIMRPSSAVRSIVVAELC